MSRAFVYCHVSTEEQSQDDHYSLALQEERCRDYAKAKSWRITKVRKDVGSGRNGDRPGFQELLQDVSAGAIDVVIVYRLDRLSRNVRDVYDFLERTRQADVGFVSTSEAFDTTTAMGRAMLGVAAVFSQLTREVIGENTRDGMAKRARSGKYTGSAGNPPYGHSYSTAEGKLLVEPAEAGVVRQVFDLYGHRKWGYMKIAQHLNQEGIPPRMEGAQWSPRRVAAMLRSPVYVGKLPYRGKVYDGEQEPIIDQSLFDEVQVLLASRRQLPPRSQQSQHLLSGIARCGQCGERLRAHWILFRGKSTMRYRAYRHRGNVYSGERACKGFTKAADKLEAAVVDKVRDLAASPEFQEAAFEAARKQLASDTPVLQQERDEVQSKLSDMGTQFARWAERLDAGKIDEEQFTERNAALLKEKTTLQQRLAELDARLAEHEEIEVSLEEVRTMLRDFDQTWAHLTLDEQREMLRALVEELAVWPDRGELKLVLMPPVEIDLRARREQEVAFLLAKLTLERYFRDDEGSTKPWLFPQLLRITQRWLADCVVCHDNTFPQLLLLIEFAHDAADRIYRAIAAAESGAAALKPMLQPYDTEGSTRYVDFDTTRPTFRTREDKCHVSHVVADTDSWEQKLAQTLEAMPEVLCYVKNQNLGFTIPYTLNGEEHDYVPDFIARVSDGHDDPLNLIIEVTGEDRKDKDARVATARNLWVPAINNHGGSGRWAFAEINDPWNAAARIREIMALG